MVLHHRHKQRILGTIITAIVFFLCFDIFLFLQRALSLEMTLLITFGIGIIALTLYHFYNYEHCHEHVTMINNLTQIYLGGVLIIGIILIILLRAIFHIEMANSYIVMSIIMIVLVFLTLGPYDRFLEEHLGKKFPRVVPAPTRGKKKRK